jgi:nucleoside phosphorylase
MIGGHDPCQNCGAHLQRNTELHQAIRYTSGNTKLIDAGIVASHHVVIVYGSVHKTAAEAALTVACQFETMTPKTVHTPGV